MSGKDRCRNDDVRERCGLLEDVVTRVERGVLRWFRHLEGINESNPTKQIYKAHLGDEKTRRKRGPTADVSPAPAPSGRGRRYAHLHYSLLANYLRPALRPRRPWRRRL
ncbi:hypothetical protein EVAR_61110_1 [Eumeta japonica]|uniref:Uncharacterized protein n=1 Tax=Eumeta variegata TaxID=151549 RepID=A0A4C1YLT6_EUMVA|nr:hypothetical protein EVAR_61110_1 [Eumeta japonica]